jgi:hypothetical protein
LSNTDDLFFIYREKDVVEAVVDAEEAVIAAKVGGITLLLRKRIRSSRSFTIRCCSFLRRKRRSSGMH